MPIRNETKLRVLSQKDSFDNPFFTSEFCDRECRSKTACILVGGIDILPIISFSGSFIVTCIVCWSIYIGNENLPPRSSVRGRTCRMTSVTGILHFGPGWLIFCSLKQMFSKHSRQAFTWFFGNGNRIGEAKNPGPVVSEMENFRLALINPTTLLHRKPELLQLNADAIALAETSATSKVQWETIRDFRVDHHTCLFSSPVDNQKQRIDGDTSLRGQAAGTAVIARVPMRAYRHELKPTSQTRIQFIFIQLGSTTSLLCVFYGFQQISHRVKITLIDFCKKHHR